ncbi:UNVERIFIED_CONTAM: hypothetical protein Sradi_6917000 [Sesamum radiatum]|uniref:Uncharacterized protein n=1 Tax=Sesamum radiatum TaxID=300843 RepID=A0AAW2JIT0_SESRA
MLNDWGLQNYFNGIFLDVWGMLSAKFEVIPRTLAHRDIRATDRRHPARE